jgi:hypothetical protein
MKDQSTNTVLMVRPFFFRMNEQTSVNNYYQSAVSLVNTEEVRGKASGEFDRFVTLLTANGVNVLIQNDLGQHDTPDSIFPNNWISTDQKGRVIIYPMFAANRRLEKQIPLIPMLKEVCQSELQVLDLSYFEEEHKFLEGTGSLVLDHQNKIAYMSISQRSNQEVLSRWALNSGYRTISFESFQTVNSQRLPIYHTNVMMSIGSKWAVVCAEAIDNASDRLMVIDQLSNDRQVITISEEQAARFAGNILELKNKEGQPLIIMSKSAFDAFSSAQLDLLKSHGQLVVADIETIEKYGGGSARCMLAEVFLTLKS